MASLRDVIFNALYAQPVRQVGESFREYHERQVDAVLKAIPASGWIAVRQAVLDDILDRLEALQDEVERDG